MMMMIIIKISFISFLPEASFKTIYVKSTFYQCRLETVIGPGSPEEEKLKRKLKFFFMNPVEKYHATR